jgi:hypothetical protein
VLLVLVAALGLVVAREGALEAGLARATVESDEAGYVAQAAYRHLLWQANHSSCTGYVGLPATAFGAHSYTASIAPGSGSPVAITTTATLASGTHHARSHVDVPVHDLESLQVAVLQPGSVSGKDAWIRSSHDDTNYGAYERLHIRGATDRRRTLIEFDLSSLPPNALVTEARLDLYADSVSSPGVLDVHLVTMAWREGTCGSSGGLPILPDLLPSCWADGVTWDDADAGSDESWDDDGGDFVAEPLASETVAAASAWHDFDVTDAVAAWLAGTSPNFGLLLKARSGSSPNVSFVSSDDSDAFFHPKLIVTYACECGSASCIPAGGGDLLFVATDPANLTAQEAAKKALIESWGFTVNLIDAQDPASAFDAAVAVNDVAYVTEDISAGDLGTKLVDALIGVVSEETGLLDEFGLATSLSWGAGSAITIDDNTHYVTLPFLPGPLTIFTSGGSVPILGAPLAGGLEALASLGAGPALAAQEQGAALLGGSGASGRRVALPWGANDLELADLSADGLTILRRALEWGAGADAGGGGTPHLFLSTAGSAALGSLSFGDDDVVDYDPEADVATLFFDGSNFSSSLEDVDALHILPNGHLVLSTEESASLGGLSFEDDDLVEWDPVAGTAAMYFEGDLHFSADEDVDAVHVLGNGHLVLSTEANASLNGTSFGGDDLVDYDPVARTAVVVFDGGSLFSSTNENIDGVHVQGDGRFLLSTTDDATLGGLSFGDDDVVEYDPVAGSARVVFDGGTLFASTDEDVDAIYYAELGSGGPALLEARVSADADDAEERSADGSMSLGGAVLDLAQDPGVSDTVGLRFAGLALPPGATIVAAWVQFQAAESSTGAAALLIEGQAADDAAAFSGTSFDLGSRPRTAAQAAWSPPDWATLGEAGSDQRTSDLAAIVQEIVDRPGWTSGNALALIIGGSGRRAAVAHEGTPAAAPLLHIEYTP